MRRDQGIDQVGDHPLVPAFPDDNCGSLDHIVRLVLQPRQAILHHLGLLIRVDRVEGLAEDQLVPFGEHPLRQTPHRLGAFQFPGHLHEELAVLRVRLLAQVVPQRRHRIGIVDGPQVLESLGDAARVAPAQPASPLLDFRKPHLLRSPFRSRLLQQFQFQMRDPLPLVQDVTLFGHRLFSRHPRPVLADVTQRAVDDFVLGIEFQQLFELLDPLRLELSRGAPVGQLLVGDGGVRDFAGAGDVFFNSRRPHLHRVDLGAGDRDRGPGERDDRQLRIAGLVAPFDERASHLTPVFQTHQVRPSTRRPAQPHSCDDDQTPNRDATVHVLDSVESDLPSRLPTRGVQYEKNLNRVRRF